MPRPDEGDAAETFTPKPIDCPKCVISVHRKPRAMTREEQVLFFFP